MKSKIEKKTPFLLEESKVFTRGGSVRQSKKLAKFIWQNASIQGYRTFNPTYGVALIRVEFDTNKHQGLVKYLQVTSHCKHGNKIEYFYE